jgi:hypothetical protein
MLSSYTGNRRRQAARALRAAATAAVVPSITSPIQQHHQHNTRQRHDTNRSHHDRVANSQPSNMNHLLRKPKNWTFFVALLISVRTILQLQQSFIFAQHPHTPLQSSIGMIPIPLEQYPRDFTIIEAKLRYEATPFYMYGEEDHYDLLQTDILEWFRSGRKNMLLRKRFSAEAKQEDQALMVMSNHSFRTTDKTKADVFIVPFRVGVGIINRDPRKLRAFVKALLSNTTFREQPHVVLSLTTVGFNQFHVKNTAFYLGMDNDFYSNVSSLIVAQSHDSHSCANISHQGAAHGHDFEGEFKYLDHAMSKYGFSVGLLPQIDLPYHEATYEKFRNAKNFIFYQTRTEPSVWNSTRFRQILLEPQFLNQMNWTNSSIGFGLPPDEWIWEFPRSKFCLAIRGDTPHTHALLHAVKVGCIPVVISDFYPAFAPSFPSTLKMEEYCIFIPEDDYIRDPSAELLKLMYLSEEEIRRKIEALAFAQKVVLMDHPESLFVEAFLKESLYAFKHPSPPELIFPPKRY